MALTASLLAELILENVFQLDKALFCWHSVTLSVFVPRHCHDPYKTKQTVRNILHIKH
jgi:hypothetical protein